MPAAELTERGVEELRRLVEATPGWRVEERTGRGGVRTKYTCYPPDPTARPIPLGTTRDPADTDNLYARFKRAGLVVNPEHLAGRKAGKPKTGISVRELKNQWTILDHARERMALRGLSESAVYTTAARPERTEPGNDPDTIKAYRGDTVVVLDPKRRAIVTTYIRGGSDPVTGDGDVDSDPLPAPAVQQRQKPAEPATAAVTPELPTPTRAVSAAQLQKIIERTRAMPPMTRKNEELVFEWGEPTGRLAARPKSEARLSHIEAALPRLKAKPGEWAKVLVFAGSTTAGGLVKKVREAFPDIEVRSNASGAGKGSALYVRYPEK